MTTKSMIPRDPSNPDEKEEALPESVEQVLSFFEGLAGKSAQIDFRYYGRNTLHDCVFCHEKTQHVLTSVKHGAARIQEVAICKDCKDKISAA